MNEFQGKLLEMLTWLHEFLQKHHLNYYVIGGTMLGAVRHQGFIPWDDDADIAMPRKDYEKLIDLLKDPVDHYVVESVHSPAKDYSYLIAKLYDTNTTLIDASKTLPKRGLFIDIFPLDGIGETKEDGVKNYKKIKRMCHLHAVKVCRRKKGRKWWKNLAAACGGLLPVRHKNLARKIDAACSRLSFEDSAYVGTLHSGLGEREIMPKSVYGTPTPYTFEGITVFGPEQYDDYLTRLYRNWRQLPPEDKRDSGHDFVFVDLKTPYL